MSTTGTISAKKGLQLLFDRPSEPIFIGKGDENAAFQIPNDYLTDRYQSIGVQLTSRFGEEATSRIPIKKITLPSLGDITSLGRREPFSVFIPKHQRLSGRLIEMFMGMRTIEDLQSFAVYTRDRVNPFLFNYALSVALLHRPDTQGISLPNFMETFPEKYMDGAVFAKAREEASVVPAGSRVPIEIPRDYTSSDLEEEHRLAYFREDMGVNLHHWHWHLVYPFEGPRNIVAKDRRGELFYYMHQQIVARYNVERMCNKLNRVERYVEWKQPIKKGYFPKLDSLVASRAWPARVENTVIRNLNRSVDLIKQDVDDLIRWRDRIFDAIHSGVIRSETGQQLELREINGFDEGIDYLGNMIEASPVLSPNTTLYGNLHNMGHLFIAYSHDPDHRFLENFGVMGDSATAMRDPVFYRWHAYIDDIFNDYKATIPRYTVNQLQFSGVTIPKIEVVTQGESNVFQTYWQQSDIDLSRGMDFVPRGAVLARFTHLQHTEFSYRLQINNTTGNQVRGTVRIFLGPQFDERGVPFMFREHRRLFIELDKFTVTLRQGQNQIQRPSSESSVTIPFERTFRNLDANRPASGDALAQFNLCGCGWPQHMLIPKGTPEGYPMILFVMVSDYRNDAIEQTLEGTCNDASSYCGIKDRRYPDRRSMGFPFDRYPRNNVETLNEFLTTNMAIQNVVVRFTDRTIVRGQNPTVMTNQGGSTTGNRGQVGNQLQGGNQGQTGQGGTGNRGPIGSSGNQSGIDPRRPVGTRQPSGSVSANAHASVNVNLGQRG